MAHDPLGQQRFEQGTHKYGDMLGDAQRAHENTQHARSQEGGPFDWKAAILLLILIAGVVGGLLLLYQTAGPAGNLP